MASSQEPPSGETKGASFSGSRWVLWLAQGCGSGCAPFAPGTFGSLAGVLWMLVLSASGSLWVYGLGCLVTVALSVWACGVAERMLQQTDPGSVVLDEICAIPLTFLGWVLWATLGQGQGLSPELFYAGHRWLILLAGFAAFRFFDILKPWPVGRSQALPGGWGITADDVLAALYANAVVLGVAAWVG
jgi:phosphatidylglycerophosphatase A